MSRASGDSYFADDVIGRVVVLGFSSRSSVGQLTGEMYKHMLPPNGLGLLHYWTIPFVQDFVWGSDLHDRWTCRHFLGWEFQLRKFGFMSIAEHMRRSVKSEMGVAKKRRVSEAGMLDYGSEQEFSLSTLGLFALLSWFAADRRVSNAAAKQEASDRAALLLRIILSSFLDGRTFRLPVAEDQTLEIVDGLVLVRVIVAAWPDLQRALSALGELAPMSELLVVLVAMVRRPSRHGQKSVSAASRAVVALVSALAVRFELCKAKHLTTQALVSLPVLRLRTERPRRISTARKRAMMKAVATTKGIRRPEAFLAAQEISAKASGSKKGLSSKSGAGFVKDERFNYFLASRELFHTASHVALVTDAGRVAGDDMLITVCVSPEAEKSCWAPPQARFGGQSPKCSRTAGPNTSQSRHVKTSQFVHVKGVDEYILD